MDRYTRVLKPRDETPMNENEIRITAQGRIRNYISYATTLLEEKDYNEIVIKAMGRAINKTIMIVELIKRRIEGLHQNTSIESADITDVWEPLEEGLLPLETIRHVSMITVTLSKKELDTSSPGYQPPIPADQVKPLTNFDYGGEFVPSSRGRGRGRGRGRSRGMMMNGAAGYGVDGNWEGGRGGYGGGRGSGYGYGGRRGRGGRGRGRGSYGGGGRGGEGNYYDASGDMEAEEHEEPSGAYDGAETDVPPPQGRGRGRGGRGRGRGGGGRGRGRA